MGTCERTLADEPRVRAALFTIRRAAVLTVAQSKPGHPYRRRPHRATRTRRVPGSDEPTHTRVPITPSDGTPSLVPVRVDGPPRSQRRAKGARALVLGALAVLLAGAFALHRLRSASVAATRRRSPDGVVAFARDERAGRGARRHRPAASPSRALPPRFIRRSATESRRARAPRSRNRSRPRKSAPRARRQRVRAARLGERPELERPGSPLLPGLPGSGL
jgi:hypothetical protein